jgi:hypothetical protein
MSALHPTADQLLAGVDYLRQAPKDVGTLELIVRRPAVNEREVLVEGSLDTTVGLVGDTWPFRGSRRTADGAAHPDMQLNVMNARAAALVAGPRERWPLAGDQLYLDFDVSRVNAPAGARLAVGDAIIEITDQPHTGCGKFMGRFGPAAMAFVNSPVGRSLNARGVNARVVKPGTIRTGDVVRKLPAAGPDGAA